jgi:hypothetical protein
MSQQPASVAPDESLAQACVLGSQRFCHNLGASALITAMEAGYVILPTFQKPTAAK